MKRYRFIKRIIPTTFRARMLLSLVVLSLGPLLLLSVYLITVLDETIQGATQSMGEEIIDYVVDLQKQHLVKQVINVNRHLEEIQKTVLLARFYLEQAYNNPELFPATRPLVLKKEQEGFYWEEEASSEHSNVGISARATLTDDLLERLKRSSYVEPIFKQSMANNPHIAAMYFILPESAWRFYPKMNVRDEIRQGFLPADVDLTTYPFYYLATEVPFAQYATVWTEPYLDITHRDLLFTATSPVYSQTGELLGVIAADITISNVVDHILNFQFKENNAYALLLDHQGKIIAAQEHVNQEELLFFEQNASRLQAILLANAPQVINVFHQEKIIITAQVPSTTWYLSFVIPREEITSPIFQVAESQLEESQQHVVLSLMIALLVLTLLLLGISLVTWRQFTQPLQQLMAGISSFLSTNKYQPLETGHLAEFNQLACSFNTMASQVEQLINDLNELNQHLEHKVLERTEELAKVNASLQESNRLLRQMEQVKRETFAHITHDLKTPLTIIVGYIDAIMDDLVSEEKLKYYLQRMSEHIDSINKMVRDVYELSIVEMKEKTYQFIEVKPYQYFNSILTKYHHTERLLIHMEKDLPPIHIDREYMKRAIYNLLDNAIKYSPPDTAITISIVNKDGQLSIAISDQGQGIPETELEHIFKPFYRIDKSRNSKIPGNGLGLSIVKEIILAHQGEIKVDSVLGLGSTFTLFIPVQNHHR